MLNTNKGNKHIDDSNLTETDLNLLLAKKEGLIIDNLTEYGLIGELVYVKEKNSILLYEPTRDWNILGKLIKKYGICIGFGANANLFVVYDVNTRAIYNNEAASSLEIAIVKTILKLE